MQLKKYGWPALALILLIIFLLCNWTTETTTIVEEPTPDEPVPTWQLIVTIPGGKDGLLDGETWTETVDFGDDLPTFGRGDPNFRIEFEHFWDEHTAGGCIFPCINPVTWDVDDSTGFVCHHLEESNPVNTFGNPEILQGAWDGNAWTVSVLNGCICTINYDWQLNIYAYEV